VATKLKNLKIKKVDFVDEGANPDAHIKMIKRKEGEGQNTGEGGKKESGNILNRLLNFIGKAAGMDQSEIDSAVDEIKKSDSVSFREQIDEVNNRKIADEMWDVCYALQYSLCSILNDRKMDGTDAAAAMQESLDEFYAAVQESIQEWSGGKEAGIVRKKEEVSKADLEIMKAAAERLNLSIQKAGMGDRPNEKTNQQGSNDQKNNSKGEEAEMKIDKSKLTDAEKAFLESIEKRCGTEEDSADGNGGGAEATSLEKSVHESAAQAENDTVSMRQDQGGDDIYKGLHPAVKAQLEELRKFRDGAETRELTEIAKRYVIIGKKEEELVPLLKSLKAAGGTAYHDMIALLDQAVDTVEKSGFFSEIGRSGHGSPGGNCAEMKINGIAKGYMEKNPALSYSQAIAKAWEDNPDVLAEYDEEAGF
jgi:hypothetical protein